MKFGGIGMQTAQPEAAIRPFKEDSATILETQAKPLWLFDSVLSDDSNFTANLPAEEIS